MVSGTESANKQWDSVSPQLRQSLADSGTYLPGSEEWTRLSEDLVPSTTANHVLNVVQFPAANLYSETFANFAVEIVQGIPAADFFKYFRYQRLKKISKAKYHRLAKAWIRRMRIFLFDERVTNEHLSTLRGFVNEGTPIPLIDALWHQGRIIDISIRELLEVAPAKRAQRAMLLSVGLEVFNFQRDEQKSKKLLEAIMTATIKKKRGGAQRKPKDFTPEVCERFAKKKTNELQPLWDSIIEFFQKAGYDTGCVRAVKELDWFKQRSATCTHPVPEDLLRRVFERERKGGQEYWPRTFALLHAKFELGITTENEISTLHTLYYKGNKLLKESSESNAPLKDIPQ
jgi:hypothetical protein